MTDRPGGLSELRSGGQIRAAMDLGTNSFHLLVARVDSNGRFDVIAKEKEVVRLGSGAGDMSQLQADAIDRGIITLKRFRQVADSFDAEVSAVATSALREASNRTLFLERAASEAGVDVQVVSGVEEARLIHLGVLQSLPVYDEEILVVDIGGGSTEFLVGLGSRVRSAHSTKLGAIRLTDRFFPEGVVSRKSAKACRTHIESFLVPTALRLAELRPFQAIGSSGTINTVARMIVAQRGGDPDAPTNGLRITRSELAKVARAVLGTKKPSARKNIPGLDDRRRDIIVAGVLLLEGIFDALDLDDMLVSESALREGILLDAAARVGEPAFHHLSDIRRESVLRMAELYHEELGHIQRATDLALHLFDAVQSIHGLDLGARDLLEAAGMLHNVGLFISHAAHHKHSYYVIRNSDQLNGFTNSEIELVALVARYHRKSSPKPSHAAFQALDSTDQSVVRTLAGLLRIGISLDRTRQGGVTRLDVNLESDPLTITVATVPGVDYSLELYTANQRSALLSEVLERDIAISLEQASTS